MNSSDGKTHYKNGLGLYEAPKLAVVEVEEIVFVQLEDGEKTKKLNEPVQNSSAECQSLSQEQV
jgi:hypothetical protein